LSKYQICLCPLHFTLVEGLTSGAYHNNIRAMKFISRGFIQEPGNPLKIPGGGKGVPKCTIFSIGSDDIPFDPTGHGLEGEDLRIFRALFGAGALVPLESPEGRRILAECEHSKKLEVEMKRVEIASHRPYKYWYERPAGLIAIRVFIGIVVVVAVAWLARYFPQWIHPATPSTQKP
jgi:hypothetical protein